ncbi:MAG: hypothetical protein ACE5K0_06550 [Candidatus Methanofastidiosia archaeon]
MMSKKSIALVLITIILISGCISQTNVVEEENEETKQPQEKETETQEVEKEEEQEEITVEVPETPTTKEYNQIMNDLEKNFPELVTELKELPEIKDGISKSDLEALNDIYFLWKNATNPEVKEAFDLMIKGGNPYREQNLEIEKNQEAIKNIKIDGKKGDWNELKPLCTDVKGDTKEDVDGTDIKAIYGVIDKKKSHHCL